MSGRSLCLALLAAIAPIASGAQSSYWTSEGYGYFFDAGADTLDHTTTGCIG